MQLLNTFHILPGPIYEPRAFLNSRYIEFSKFSYGTLVALGIEDEKYTFRNFKIVLVGCHQRFTYKEKLKLFTVAYREFRLLNRKKVDLIICYDPLKTGLMGLIFKLLSSAKLIVEVNGIYNSPVLYANRGRKQALKGKYYPKIQNFIMSRADGLKCLFKGQLSGYSIPKKVKTEYFFDYTDIVEVERPALGKKIILTIGYPVFVKGIDNLIDVFSELYTKYPDWKLLIVGYFFREPVPIETVIAGRPGIEVRKPVTFREIPDLIDACDIFVLASRSEAMGRVLIEAMARGKARIGTRVGGIPTVVNHNQDGLLVESDNKTELKEAIEKLINSEELRLKFGCAGIKRFREEFTLQNFSHCVKSFYYEVMSS